MDIKKRFIISNTITAIVPVIITVITISGFLFVSSKFLGMDMNYDGFKKNVLIRSELVAIRNDILKQNIENVEETKFQENLSQQISSLNGKFIIIKEHKIIANPNNINKIDIEKCMELVEKNKMDKKIVIDRISYMVEVININSKDNAAISLILLAPIGEDISLLNKLIIAAIVVYIISFIITNMIMSYLFSKRIIKPIKDLKKATIEISTGNLNCEIIEDGDKEIQELCHGFEAMRVQLKDSITMKMKYDDNRKVLLLFCWFQEQ